MFAYVRYYSNIKHGTNDTPTIVRKKETVTSIAEMNSVIYYLNKAHADDKYFRLVEPGQTIKELERNNNGVPVPE